MPDVSDTFRSCVVTVGYGRVTVRVSTSSVRPPAPSERRSIGGDRCTLGGASRLATRSVFVKALDGQAVVGV